MSRPDGGPAFPQTDLTATYERDGAHSTLTGFDAGGAAGMTLRDYFAAKALAGYRAAADPNLPGDKVAEWAYMDADAMLAERDKP